MVACFNSNPHMMDLTSLEQDVSQTHPMLFNIVVLENLFKIVPLEDLLNMRGVCKLWWKLSLPFVRSSSQIRIEGRGSLGSTHRYEDFLALASPTKDDKFGFMRYPFEDFNCDWTTEGSDVIKLCARYGSQIKRLKINGCSFDISDFRKMLFELLPNLESFFGNIHLGEFYKAIFGGLDCPVHPIKTMKSLDLSISRRRGFGSFQSRLSWLEIFQCYPVLTALGLHDIEILSESDSNTQFENVLLAMKTVSENSGTKWKIKKLNLRRIVNDYATDYASTPFTPVVLEYLRQLQFPLRSLSLDVFNSNKAVSDFLNIYSGGLQELTMNSDWSGFFLKTSKFDCLSKLHLIGDISNLHFLKFTRNLKTLWIESGINKGIRASEWIRKPFQSKGQGECFRHPLGDFEEKNVGINTLFTIQRTNFTKLDGLVLQSLEELVVGHEMCLSDDLWALVKLMPNITRLAIGLDNDGFRLLCNNLKGLTALDIEPSRVDEYGITGTVFGLDVQLPNITDLKNLRFFGIGKALSLAANLSEVAVKNGLLQLSNLHDIYVYCSKNVSKETFTQLCQKYPRSCIRRSHV